MVFKKKGSKKYFAIETKDGKLMYRPNQSQIAYMRKRGYTFARLSFIKEHVLYRFKEESVG